jgi:hypothetical protein
MTRHETAALQDFDLAYDRFGVKPGIAPDRPDVSFAE